MVEARDQFNLDEEIIDPILRGAKAVLVLGLREHVGRTLQKGNT